tara:strand:+ start:2605 stop:2871 length:267 start_codon:yes stop_codon:yes gene_type:complete
MILKPGDYIKYRSWRESDGPFDTFPPHRRGWDEAGVIVSTGDWRVGCTYLPEESATVLTESGDLVEVCTRDVELICEDEEEDETDESR